MVKKSDTKKKSKENKPMIHYAGFWRRLAAFLIDSFILIAFAFVLIIFTHTLYYIEVLRWFTTASVLLLALGYHPYFLTTKGATPGKQVMGLIVVDKNNYYPISLGKALLREILGRHIIDRALFHIGDLAIIFDSKKQALHDKIGGTYVVYKDSLSSKQR